MFISLKDFEQTLIKDGLMILSKKEEITSVSAHFLSVFIENKEGGNYVVRVEKNDVPNLYTTGCPVKEFLYLTGIKNDPNAKLYKINIGGLHFGIELSDPAIPVVPAAFPTTDKNEANKNEKTMKGKSKIHEDVVDIESLTTDDCPNLHTTNALVAAYKGLHIVEYDYTRLESHVWLTSNVVEFMMTYYFNELIIPENFRNLIFVAPIHFYDDYKKLYLNQTIGAALPVGFLSSLKNYTAGINIFKKKYFFIPFLQYSHYRMYYIEFLDGKNIVLNFLDSQNDQPETEFKDVVELFFKHEAEQRKYKYEKELKFQQKIVKVPQQSRGDCGIFMLSFFKMLLIYRQINPFSAKAANQLRKDIAAIIVNCAIDKNYIFPKLKFD